MDFIIIFYKFSQDNVKDKWISTDYGYIHQSQVKDISANEFNFYIKQTILDELNKIDNETVKKKYLVIKNGLMNISWVLKMIMQQGCCVEG